MIVEITSGIVATAICAGSVWAVQRWKSKHPLDVRVEQFIDDTWNVAFPTTSPPLHLIDGRRMPCEKAYAIMVAKGAVDIEQTRLRIRIRARTKAPVLIKQMKVVAERSEPLRGVRIYSANAGASAATLLVVDLDNQEEELPVWQAREEDCQFHKIGDHPFFSRSGMTISSNEYETLILVAKTTRYLAKWRVHLEFETKGYSGLVIVDLGGRPFRTTGLPESGFAKDLEWAWHDGCRVLPARTFELE